MKRWSVLLVGCASCVLANPLPDLAREGDGATCTDGRDNDLDGFVDCADDGCTDAAACFSAEPESGAQCRDGRDNDGDGVADVRDPDCWSDTSWGERRCSTVRGTHLSGAEALDSMLLFGGVGRGLASNPGRGADVLVFDGPAQAALSAAPLTGDLPGSRFGLSLYRDDGSAFPDRRIVVSVIPADGPITEAPPIGFHAMFVSSDTSVHQIVATGALPDAGAQPVQWSGSGWADFELAVVDDDASGPKVEISSNLRLDVRPDEVLEATRFPLPPALVGRDLRIRIWTPDDVSSGPIEVAQMYVDRPDVDPCGYAVPQIRTAFEAPMPLTLAAAEMGAPQRLCAVTESDGGTGILAHRSDDGGRTFTNRQSVFAAAELYAVAMAWDPTAGVLVGVAAGVEGAFEIRSDDCLHWEQLDPIAGVPLDTPGSRYALGVGAGPVGMRLLVAESRAPQAFVSLWERTSGDDRFAAADRSFEPLDIADDGRYATVRSAWLVGDRAVVLAEDGLGSRRLRVDDGTSGWIELPGAIPRGSGAAGTFDRDSIATIALAIPAFGARGVDHLTFAYQAFGWEDCAIRPEVPGVPSGCIATLERFAR